MYSSIESLADVGYQVVDLDENGVPELIISAMADDKMIYDLYTYADGEVIHLASSFEHERYTLGSEHAVYACGSSSAMEYWTIKYKLDSGGSLKITEYLQYNGYKDENNPWFYGTGDCYAEDGQYDYDRMSPLTEEEAEEIEKRMYEDEIDLELTPFDQYKPQEDVPQGEGLQGEDSQDIRLKTAFQSAIGDETEEYFFSDDFDGDGIVEAYGVSGTQKEWYLGNSKIYYIDGDGFVLCVDEISNLYGYGDVGFESEDASEHMIMDTGSDKFLILGGTDGQKTWLYGVKDGKSYQPEVSGVHEHFYETEDGVYRAVPHEGGAGYYEYYYTYDSTTGEFVRADE